MNFREAYREIDGMGKAGALTMAGGLLALTTALGLETTNDIAINGQPVTEVSAAVNIKIGAAGVISIVVGQQLLIAGYRRNESTRSTLD